MESKDISRIAESIDSLTQEIDSLTKELTQAEQCCNSFTNVLDEIEKICGDRFDEFLFD